MKYTLSEQIRAIQEAQRLVSTLVEIGLLGTDSASLLSAKLNDAGSTIAAINLVPKDKAETGEFGDQLY